MASCNGVPWIALPGEADEKGCLCAVRYGWSMNDKQRAFVREYLIDRNATQAAIRAGYSEKTAYSIGQRLLKNVEVAAATKLGEEEHAERCAVTVESLTREYEKNLAMARASGQVSAANQAVTGIVELHGLKVTKTENINRNYAVGSDPIESVEEWQEQHSPNHTQH